MIPHDFFLGGMGWVSSAEALTKGPSEGPLPIFQMSLKIVVGHIQQSVCQKLPDRSNDNTFPEIVLWASGGGWENAWNSPRISSVPLGVWEFLSRSRVSEVSLRGVKGTLWMSLAGACLCLMEFLQAGFSSLCSDAGSALHWSVSLSITWNFLNWDWLEKRMQPHCIVTEPRGARCICWQSFQGVGFF